MENNNEQIKKTDGVSDAKVGSKKIPTAELVRQLEEKSISPGALDKRTKRECLLHCVIIRGYKSRDIAVVFGVNIRSAQRYIDKIRHENTLWVDEFFQRRIVNEYYRNWQSRYQRLLHLSYSDKLSDAEMIKAISRLEQFEINKIAVLERLGCVSREYGIAKRDEAIRDSQIDNLIIEINDVQQTIDDNAKSIEGMDKSSKEYSEAFLKMCKYERELKEYLRYVNKSLLEIREKGARKEDKNN